MSHEDRVFFGNFLGVLGVLLVLAFVFFFIASSVVNDGGISPAMQAQTDENIKPIGDVYVEGESAPDAAPAPTPAPAAAAPSAAPAPVAAASEGADGKTIYARSCLACHMTGVANAPKFGDAAAWAPRIAKGMDTLLTNATNGINAMPPKGTCMGCSDDELRAAIGYMIENSQ